MVGCGHHGSLTAGILAFSVVAGSLPMSVAAQWYDQPARGKTGSSLSSTDSEPAARLLPIQGLGRTVPATERRDPATDSRTDDGPRSQTQKDLKAQSIGFRQEALPRPLQASSQETPETESSPSNAQETGQDQGIVRLLKPLAVQPRDREVLTQRYPDGKIQVERTVRRDSFDNYLNHGKWKMYHTDGQLMGIGLFEQGQMVGLWKRLHFDRNNPWFQTADFQGFEFPLISTAEFRDGQLHGLWVIKDAQQRMVFQLEYEDGQRNGTGTWWYANGQMRRQLTCEDNLLHGQWQEWSENGEPARENWFRQGRRISKNISYFHDRQPEVEQTYLEQLLELSEPDDWWNARLGSYEPTGETVQEGPVRAWYDNGQRHMAGYFKGGVQDGEFAWWHPNGNRKLIGVYQDGQRTGHWTWWHENGIKAAEVDFEDDQPVTELLTWDENGVPQTMPESADPFSNRRRSTARPPIGSQEDLPMPRSVQELDPDSPTDTSRLEELPGFGELELELHSPGTSPSGSDPDREATSDDGAGQDADPASESPASGSSTDSPQEDLPPPAGSQETSSGDSN